MIEPDEPSRQTRSPAAARNGGRDASALDWARDAGEAEAVIGDLRRYLLRRRRRRLGAMAGALTLVCAGTMVFGPWRVAPPPASSPTAVDATVLRPGVRTLADGTVVELKGDAQIDAIVTETVRHVTLRRGEAHFDVAKDPARPFVVHAAGVEVRAVGTAFAVQLGYSAVDIVVTEGTVAVDRARPGAAPRTAEPATPPGAMAPAGTRVVVALAPADGKAAAPVVQRISTGEIEQRLAWRRVRLEFTDTPLSEVVRMFNQARGEGVAGRFVLDDAALGGLQVSGVLRPDNEESLLLLLEKEFRIEAVRRGDEVVLRRAR